MSSAKEKGGGRVEERREREEEEEDGVVLAGEGGRRSVWCRCGSKDSVVSALTARGTGRVCTSLEGPWPLTVDVSLPHDWHLVKS